jgi:hypothetical protein
MTDVSQRRLKWGEGVDSLCYALGLYTHHFILIIQKKGKVPLYSLG